MNTIKQKTNSLDSDSIKNYFDTGLVLSNGWRIGRFPRYGDQKIGSPQNSKTQIIVKKGNKQIRMNQFDGRLGGQFRIIIDHNTTKGYDSVSFMIKEYDEALTTIHSLMRIIK